MKHKKTGRRITPSMGGKALLKKYGRKYFSDLANRRWKAVKKRSRAA